MVPKPISWILDFTAKLKPEVEQIKCLQANDSTAMRTVLRFCFDPQIEWLLPPGTPPYTECTYTNVDNMLYSEARRLYLFVKGGNDYLKPLKRESMFISLLESVHPKDAELLVSIKEKKLPFKGLSSTTVLKAFPGLY